MSKCKWWKVWFLFPALVSWSWVSKKTEKEVLQDIRDNLFYPATESLNSALRKWHMSQKQPQLQQPIFDMYGFDVQVWGGDKCLSSCNIEAFKDKSATMASGTVDRVTLASPAMDTLKYTTSVIPRKKFAVTLRNEKTVNVNDILSLPIDVDIQGVPIGTIHLEWKCTRW